MMKAAVFEGPGRPLAIKDVPTPKIGDAEMLVKVRRCGICGTDIHASREGPFMAPQETVFGHEFVGDIVEVGAAVNGPRQGSLVHVQEGRVHGLIDFEFYGIDFLTGYFVRKGPEIVLSKASPAKIRALLPLPISTSLGTVP